MELCEYECGQESRYTLTNGKQCCSETYQRCPAIKDRNRKGVKKAHTEGKMPGFNDAQRQKSIDTKKSNAITNFSNELVDSSSLSNGAIKRHLYSLGVLQCCSECKLDTWNKKPLPLELDHINGKNTDNRIENLRLLCPNCHSLTDTWRGRNINGNIKVSDEDLLTAYSKCANIRQTLLEVGLSPKGGNYNRIYKLISR
tara:strand:+ start:107 stop:703 length:597 start_codon:yes stop_codon:yes gene_type:complete